MKIPFFGAIKKVISFLTEHPSLIFFSILAFLLTRYSITYGAGSDPRYTLIVTQSIIENGTIRLNEYKNDQIWGKTADFDADINILDYNGGYYNYFPVGPSILSIPFVLITKAIDWDMRVAQDNINAQRLLSSFSVIVILWLIYLITRLLLPHRDSLIITAVSLFGSTLISSLGVALWSLNYSLIFISMSIWLIVRYDLGKTYSVHPFLLGLLLFLAFFCRASSVAFILPLFLYLLYKGRRQLLLTAMSSGFLVIFFFLWSKYEFGTWLPIYYSFARLQEQRIPIWLSLAGHLISPSRGLFTFMPFLILFFPALFNLYHNRRPKPLIWLCLLWIFLQLFMASRAAIWWGGHSYGPRILTELMLAFILLTAIFWQQIRTQPFVRRKRYWITSYLILGATAIIIHSYQGLYNNRTAVWNSVITEHPTPPITSIYGDLFNWHIPQFLASNQMLCRLEEERTRSVLVKAPLLLPYPWDTPITYGPDKVTDLAVTARWLRGESDFLPTHQALFLGWEPIDNDRAPYRAAACDTLHILFTINTLPAENPIKLTIKTAAFGQQTAIFLLNEQPIGQLTFRQQPKLTSETGVLLLEPQYFQPGNINDLTILLPNASRARYNDPTLLSLAIESITFSP